MFTEAQLFSPVSGTDGTGPVEVETASDHPGVGLPVERIPQLGEVTARVRPLTGFRYEPVAGLATLRHFYGSIGDGIFLSTQYIRHHSVPLCTPEPDVVHEVLGHAHTLAVPALEEVYRAAGQAAQRVETAEALEFLSKVFWFTPVVFARAQHRAPVRRAAALLHGVRRRDARPPRRPRRGLTPAGGRRAISPSRRRWPRG